MTEQYRYIEHRPSECTFLQAMASKLAFRLLSIENRDTPIEELLVQPNGDPLWDSMEVPPSFLADRPNVRFIPLWEDESDAVQLSCILPKRAIHKPILASQHVIKIQQAIVEAYSKPHFSDFYHYCTKTLMKVIEIYITNLELYQLTKDPYGSIKRWGSQTDVLFDATKQGKWPPYAYTYHPFYLELSTGRKTTHWFRHDEKHVPHVVPYRSVLLETSLNVLEKFCYIGYDSLNTGTILAMQK